MRIHRPRRSLLLSIAALLICCVSGASLRAQYERQYTLDECITIAKRSAPALLVARDAYSIAKENGQAAELSLRSTVDMSFFLPSYTENVSSVYNINTETYQLASTHETEFGAQLNVNQPIFWTGGNLQLAGNLYRVLQTNIDGTANNDYLTYASITFNQPIFLANTLKIQDQQNHISLDLAHANYVSQLASLYYNVKSSFYSLYQSEKQLEIQKLTVDIADSAYQLAERKYKGGLIAEVEALQAEAALATAQATYYDNQRALDAAERNLMITIGLPVTEKGLARLDSLSAINANIPQDLAIGEALKNRSDLLSAKYAITQDTFALELQQNQRQVNLQLAANIGLTQTATTVAMLYQDPPVNRGVSLTLNVPIFDWGAHALKVDAAQTEIELAKTTYDLQLETVKEGVRESVEQILSARKQIEVANKAVEISTKAYELSKRRFDNGSISSQDLTIAQQTLTQARTTALNAIVVERLALASLTQQTLYDFETNRPIEMDEK